MAGIEKKKSCCWFFLNWCIGDTQWYKRWVFICLSCIQPTSFINSGHFLFCFLSRASWVFLGIQYHLQMKGIVSAFLLADFNFTCDFEAISNL